MDFPKSQVFLTIKTFVFNDEGKFVTLFRTETAPSRPLTWDLPGGAFEVGETPEECARREIKEEAGIEVTDMRPLTVVGAFNSKNEFWVTVAYTAKALNTEITLSYEHNDFKWVTAEEFLKLESSQKWKDIVQEHLLNG